jgi:hypothetical protein
VPADVPAVAERVPALPAVEVLEPEAPAVVGAAVPAVAAGGAAVPAAGGAPDVPAIPRPPVIESEEQLNVSHANVMRHGVEVRHARARLRAEIRSRVFMTDLRRLKN